MYQSIFLGIFLFVMSTLNAGILTLKKQVHGNKNCDAFLYYKKGAKNLKLNLYLWGNGIFVFDKEKPSQSTQPVIDAGKVAVLMVGKPGLRLLPPKISENKLKKQYPDLIKIIKKEKPEKYRIGVFKEFYDHMQEDIVSCSEKAILWALKQPFMSKKNRSILLRGHSEGTENIVRLIERIYKTKSKLRDKIKAIILTGSVINGRMANYKTRTDFNLKDKKSWFATMSSGDFNKMLKLKDFTFGYKYFKEVYNPKHPSIKDRLLGLKKYKPNIKIYFFQGLQDTICAPKLMLDFEKLVKKDKGINKEFEMQFRYYNAPHWLNEEAWEDLASITERALL